MDQLNIQIPIREQIANIIRKRILDGYYASNQKLVERELSQEFNISATPIKEAFRILESEQLVYTIPRKGTMVTSIKNGAFLDFMMARSSLEGAIAGIATKKLTDEDIEEMDSILKKASEYIESGDAKEAAAINERFHNVIRKACGNSYLLKILESIKDHENYQRTNALKDIEERKVGFQEHCEILNALKERDEEKAEDLMRKHIRRSGLFAFDRIPD